MAEEAEKTVNKRNMRELYTTIRKYGKRERLVKDNEGKEIMKEQMDGVL
jgi:hypothetical protein